MMVDIFTKEKRSEIMSRVRSKDTRFEKTVFKELRRRGLYFQRHYRKVPGTPDLVRPSKKIAVFLDSDFWHGWQFSRWSDKLSSKFWVEKIGGNRKRDRRNFARLRGMDWRVLRVWEHELRKDFDSTIGRIEKFLGR